MQRILKYSLVSLYIVLVILAWTADIVVNDGDLEAAWIYSFILGMPWALMFTAIFAEIGVDTIVGKNVLTIIYISINIVLLYLLGTWITRKFTAERIPRHDDPVT